MVSGEDPGASAREFGVAPNRFRIDADFVSDSNPIRFRFDSDYAFDSDPRILNPIPHPNSNPRGALQAGERGRLPRRDEGERVDRRKGGGGVRFLGASVGFLATVRSRRC